MLDALVSIIDKTLRARLEIFEYSNCPQCIFRVQLLVTANEIALSDGTRLSAGSRLINLHLWNEHVAPFPVRGPTLGWARRMSHDLEVSLEELASFVANSPALEDVAAIAAMMAFGSTEQTQLIAHLAERYGFVRSLDTSPSHSIAQRLHQVGEDILISMIVISHNPAAFRTSRFRRDRVPVYLHRAELMRRFGSPSGNAAVH
jgi:hypothetical protein